jgi:transcriptional regulator with XRE-family HTH domain
MTIDPIYKKIGVIIRARRKSLGMTQKELAGKLSISRGALANIETGRQNILIHQLYNFAEKLELQRFALMPERLPISKEKENAGWNDLPLPTDLKAEHRKQIAQLIEEAKVEGRKEKKKDHA